MVEALAPSAESPVGCDLLSLMAPRSVWQRPCGPPFPPVRSSLAPRLAMARSASLPPIGCIQRPDAGRMKRDRHGAGGTVVLDLLDQQLDQPRLLFGRKRVPHAIELRQGSAYLGIR